jgi:hypothetical protein
VLTDALRYGALRDKEWENSASGSVLGGLETAMVEEAHGQKFRSSDELWSQKRDEISWCPPGAS